MWLCGRRAWLSGHHIGRRLQSDWTSLDHKLSIFCTAICQCNVSWSTMHVWTSRPSVCHKKEPNLQPEQRPTEASYTQSANKFLLAATVQCSEKCCSDSFKLQLMRRLSHSVCVHEWLRGRLGGVSPPCRFHILMVWSMPADNSLLPSLAWKSCKALKILLA